MEHLTVDRKLFLLGLADFSGGQVLQGLPLFEVFLDLHFRTMAALVKNAITAARPSVERNLKIALHYARAELTPPKPSELGQVASGFNNVLTSFRTGRWKQLTVRDAWINVLVGIEVGCWFFVGECIGKRHIVGYYIPNEHH
ncbi:ATP synthase subunit g, mitochondrial-like [Frankliniella occidentalis]|uniref:ATP synthase subunit g, mitochondrial-like n=1 Tax=Frankliniella occidentalis TaxID=133901 RepID=A0A6J1RZB5_FRAOC|nr:ATP synthase subunit g, mitochondrial-like [Frankliniella occidentalis]